MEKKRWLWKRISSDKSPGETESSGSVSSHSERCSDEQEALRVSPNRSNQSPDVTSKAVPCTEDANHNPSASAESPEVTSKAVTLPDNINDDSLEEDGSNAKNDINSVKEVDVNDGLRNLSDKVSAALVNVSAKEDLVKQHAKVAEEAIAGWEKAENEAAVLKKQLEAANLRNSTLEDRVSHLDGALKECVRQLRQTRDEQEKNIHDAVLKQTYDLEVAKLRLENQLLELQSKLGAADSRSPDLDLHQKVERLQKENTTLKHELQAQSEELEIMTIERDLSTQAAETASKQHLETIKKVTKLEAECRRLKTLSCRASLVNDQKTVTASSFCVESLTDSLSDNGERFNAVDIDNKSGSEPNKSDPSCSDSWASALIAELDQFKNEKSRQPSASCGKIDLMDDFLEMERLAALPEAKNESINQELVETNQCVDEKNSLRAELNIMSHQMSELKDKLERVEAEKAELEIALVKSEDCIEVSQLKLREAEIKLHDLQRELDVVNKLKQMMENQLKSMEAEAETISAKFDSLESDVDKEKALSAEIAIKYEELEQEILRSTASSYSEMKIKQEDLALAAGKLAECQKTIASLGNQLQSLATLEDFLIDTASIPGFSASPSLVARAGGDTWKLHSTDTFSPKRDSASSSTADGSIALSANKKKETSPRSSTSSPILPQNHVSSEKSRNGFAKFFSRTRSGIRLEI